ncbi:hypothetical protein QWY86_04920 [Pedobacter aquatilis]|uniref:hypothetical protein n=1 Tax=Pedobacter aquatilis TaxID=351343 RepID=UPI0025B2A0DE|nr:hypothetical protein [Pedobacter aquatilis]MDN3585997.1 hypothetical protein [Pedobacter aquatilis]
MKNLKLMAIAAIFIFLTACNNNTAEKNRESEVNTDTIDTTATGSQQIRDTTNIDSSTRTLPPTE